MGLTPNDLGLAGETVSEQYLQQTALGRANGTTITTALPTVFTAGVYGDVVRLH